MPTFASRFPLQFTGLFLVALFLGAVPSLSSAQVITFSFTGRLTVLDRFGGVITDSQNAGIFDPVGAQSPISSTLTYDTQTGIGAAGLVIAPFNFLSQTGGGAPNTKLHDILLQRIGTTHLFLGNMLADWNGINNIPLSLVWDGSGLLGALATPGGLQVGDVISGNVLMRSGSVINNNIGSAIPATDGLYTGGGTMINQGPAPLATTTYNTTPLCTPVTPGDGTCFGVNPSGGVPLTDDGIGGSPLIDSQVQGVNVNLDIGSGHSLTVTAITAVPLPPALGLFGPGLVFLFSMGYRKPKRTFCAA